MNNVLMKTQSVCCFIIDHVVKYMLVVKRCLFCSIAGFILSNREVGTTAWYIFSLAESLILFDDTVRVCRCL